MRIMMTVMGTALSVGLFLMTACSSSPEVSTSAPAANEVEASSTRYPVGEAGAAMKVEQWEISASGLVRGWDHAGRAVAEFVVDGPGGVIKSTLPDVGVRSIRGPESDTMSSEAAAYLDAFRADVTARLRAAAAEAEESSVVEKNMAGCFATYYDCYLYSLQGIMNGWWVGGDCRAPWFQCPDPRWPFAMLIP